MLRNSALNNLIQCLEFRYLKKYFLVQATFVCERNDRINRYFLFQLDSFYIEGKYHIQLNGVLGIKSFTEIDDLGPYLEKIDINSLLFSRPSKSENEVLNYRYLNYPKCIPKNSNKLFEIKGEKLES